MVGKQGGLLAVLFSLVLQISVTNGSDIEWGTYRPHALVSVRAQVPHSPLFGFVYHSLHKTNIRHLVSDEADSIRKFSWSRHDGVDGEQTIEDVALNLNITTHFVRHPEKAGWVVRFAAEPLVDGIPSQPVSVVLYAATGPEHSQSSKDHWTTFSLSANSPAGVRLDGDDKAVGPFSVRVRPPARGEVESVESTDGPGATDASRTRSRVRAQAEMAALGNLNQFFTAGVKTRPEKAWMVESLLSDAYKQHIQPAEEGAPEGAEGVPSFLLDNAQHPAAGVNFVQRVLKAPFEMDVAFIGAEGLSPQEIESVDEDLSPERVSSLIDAQETAFNARFESVFGLSRLNVPAEEIHFAKVALSNVLGGVGYFHGSSIAEEDGSPYDLDPISLLTSTPSRAIFPRGFLWDEGFHQLIVQRWDASLSDRCLRSWMDAMQGSGWIPREQVLGTEAQQRFPQHVRHLMVQKPDIANPPTLLMPLRVLASLARAAGAGENASDAEACGSFEDGKYKCGAKPKLAETPTTTTGAEFLSLAADKLTLYFDWLRETQAGSSEGTFRWRGRSLSLTAPGGYPLTLASGLDDYPRGESPSSSERHVDLQAWMAWSAGALSEMARATGKETSRFDDLASKWRGQMLEKYRGAAGLCDQTEDGAVCHEGYVTILPFVLGLLDPSDELVTASLDALEDPDRLFSPAGVRSLSTKDPMYMKGDNYWTGSVWMPFNFLTLAALKTKYSVAEGPYRARSERLFAKLKGNVLGNAFRVWKETGYLWENYSPEDGEGKSGRQFTGWTALVVLIYADMYQGVVI